MTGTSRRARNQLPAYSENVTAPLRCRWLRRNRGSAKLASGTLSGLNHAGNLGGRWKMPIHGSSHSGRGGDVPRVGRLGQIERHQRLVDQQAVATLMLLKAGDDERPAAPMTAGEAPHRLDVARQAERGLPARTQKLAGTLFRHSGRDGHLFISENPLHTHHDTRDFALTNTSAGRRGISARQDLHSKLRVDCNAKPVRRKVGATP